MSSSKHRAATGDPFAGNQGLAVQRVLPPSGRSPPTSPEKGAAAVALGECVSGLSIHRPDVALTETAGECHEDDDDLVAVEVFGDGAPAPIEGFENVGLSATSLRNMGYKIPTLLQRFSIPVVMAGRDLLLASSGKSTGKSAAFCLPVVIRLLQAQPPISVAEPRAVILAPTIQRAAEINKEAKKCSYNTPLSVVMVTAGSTIFSQMCDLQMGVDILVSTPEHLVVMVKSSAISLEATQHFIVDEIDKMVHMGLEPMLRLLVKLGMPQKSMRQTMLFTATLKPEIQRVASELLSDYICITVGHLLSIEQITQEVVPVCDWEKRNILLHLLTKELQQPPTVIFVETTSKAVQLSYWLRNEGFAPTCFHGDRTQQERESALKIFKSGLSPILVVSDAVSWSLDVQNMSHVINYDLPKRIEGYIHRIRRTGKHGLATSFFTVSDQPLAKGLAKLMTRMKQNVPDWLVECAQKLHPRDSDPYFDYLVNKFINAIAADVKAKSSLVDIDHKAVHQRQTDEYTNSALLHHNCGDKKVKYELVQAITSCGIMDLKGLYGHVNFTAMNMDNSKVEFFFAELRWDSDKKAFVPTCVVTLEENQRVGGLCGTDSCDYKDGMNIRVDIQHCYACGADLKHPMYGELYEIGHKAMSECYGYDP